MLSKHHAPRFLLLSIILTIVLYAIPYGRSLSYPLRLLSTVAHELGHGIGVLLSGGSFEYLIIHTNGAGIAFTGSYSIFSRILILIGGLIEVRCRTTRGTFISTLLVLGIEHWTLIIVDFILGNETSVLTIRESFSFQIK